MIKKIIISLLSLFIISCSTYLVFASSSKTVYTNSQMFLEDSVKTNTPGIVYFYSNDCKYCVAFSKVFNRIVKDYDSKYYFAKLNVYDVKNTDLCNRLNIQTIPAVFIYEPSENIMHWIPNRSLAESLFRKTLDSYIVKRNR